MKNRINITQTQKAAPVDSAGQNLVFSFLSANVCPWLNFGLPPRCPQIVCGVFEGRLSHFLPRWLRTGWQSAISQGKIP